MKKLLVKFLPLLILFLVFLFVIRPVLHDGLFHVYDNVQVTRTMAVYDELKSGQFPVRFFGTFGHGAGYFLLKYYSPLVYYLGAGFHAIGFSFIKAVKLVHLVFIIPGIIGMWVLLKSLHKDNWVSTVGTLAFILAPYVYHDFFHRGSLTEASAFMLLPWVLWSYISLKQNKSLLFIGLSGLSLGLCLATHSLTGFMAIGMVFAMLLIPPIDVKYAIKAIIATILGLGLSAFTIMPAFIDKNLVQYTNNDLVQRGYLDQPVGFWANLTGRGDVDIKTAFLGLPLFLGYFLTIFLLWRSPRFRKEHGSLAYWVVLVMTVGFFIMSPVSGWVWAHVESLRYTQFPFRFLTVVTVAGIISYSLIAAHLKKSKIIVSLLGLLILLQIPLYPHFYEPLGYQYGTDYKVEDPCMTTGWANEHLPIWVKKCLKAPLPSVVTPLNTVQVSDIQEKDNGRTLSFNLSGSGSVIVGKYYFPNWVAVNDRGEYFKLEPYGENGLIRLNYLGSATRFIVQYRESPLERTSDLISITSLVVLCYLLIRSYIKL